MTVNQVRALTQGNVPSWDFSRSPRVSMSMARTFNARGGFVVDLVRIAHLVSVHHQHVFPQGDFLFAQ